MKRKFINEDNNNNESKKKKISEEQELNFIKKKEFFKKCIELGYIFIECIGKKPKGSWGNKTIEDSKKLIIEKKSNFGLVTNNDFWVLDIDVRDNGLEQWNKWINEYGVPNTFTVKTGSGGFHYFFKKEKVFKKRSKLIIDSNLIGIDVISGIAYVVSPFSLHPDYNTEYKIVNGSIDNIQSCPDWIYEKLIEGGVKIYDELLINNDNENNKKQNVKENEIENEELLNKDFNQKEIKIINELSEKEENIKNIIINYISKEFPEYSFRNYYKNLIDNEEEENYYEYGIFNFNRIKGKSSHCWICNKIHDNDNTLYVTISKIGEIQVRCRRKDGDMYISIGFIEKRTQKLKDLEIILKNNEIPKEFNIKEYNNKTVISYDFIKYNIILVKSAMGTGKTQEIKKIIESDQIEDIERTFLIMFRKSLCDEMCSIIEGIIHYSKSKNFSEKKLAIQYDSLHKLILKKENILLSLDEIEGLITVIP